MPPPPTAKMGNQQVFFVSWSPWKKGSILTIITNFRGEEKIHFYFSKTKFFFEISLSGPFPLCFSCSFSKLNDFWMRKIKPRLRKFRVSPPSAHFPQISNSWSKFFSLERQTKQKIWLVHRPQTVLRPRIQCNFWFLRKNKNVDTNWNWANPGGSCRATTYFPLYHENEEELDFRSNAGEPESL